MSKTDLDLALEKIQERKKIQREKNKKIAEKERKILQKKRDFWINSLENSLKKNGLNDLPSALQKIPPASAEKIAQPGLAIYERLRRLADVLDPQQQVHEQSSENEKLGTPEISKEIVEQAGENTVQQNNESRSEQRPFSSRLFGRDN